MSFSGTIAPTMNCGSDWNRPLKAIHSGNSAGRSCLATIQPNSGTARSATFRIAGRDFLVEQDGCTYSVNKDELTFSSGSGSKEIRVTTQSACAYGAKPTVSWLHVKPATKTGTGDLIVAVDSNTSSDKRTGQVMILGLQFFRIVTVEQEGND